MARHATRRPPRRALTASRKRGDAAQTAQGASPHTGDKSPTYKTKQALREKIWSRLTLRRLGRFPFPLTDRIPNFRGAEAAAARLTTLPEWAAARRLKCNPDAAQLPVRRAALVAGSVAVDPRGARLGKGGGYSDLEFALAAERGAVDAQTLVVTTVHDAQVVRGGIPMTAHDVPVDVVATPTRLIRTRRAFRRPAGIRWEELSAAQLAAMPPLAALGRASPRR